MHPIDESLHIENAVRGHLPVAAIGVAALVVQRLPAVIDDNRLEQSLFLDLRRVKL